MATAPVVSGMFKNAADGIDQNSYDIEKYQYPAKLSEAPEYSGHKVVFFINVQGGGKVALESGGANVQEIPDSQKSNFSGEAARDAVGSVVKLDVLKKKMRLKAAIALYVPNALSNTYSVQWGTESSDAMMTGELASKAILTVMPGSEAAKAPSSATGKGGILEAGVGTAASKILNSMPYAQKASGLTPGESKAQQLFKAVDFREFSFQYSFAPQNKSEAEYVMNIIRLFKYHMLPEYYDKSQYLYIYPSEFEIKYYKGNQENTFLERQYTAVLTRMSINYTSNNQFMTFDNGMPTHINIDMSFKELSVPTKETEFATGRTV